MEKEVEEVVVVVVMGLEKESSLKVPLRYSWKECVCEFYLAGGPKQSASG